jgi:DNA-binding NarL/FixJ family response regulator
MNRTPAFVAAPSMDPARRHRAVPAVVAMHRRAAASRGVDGLRALGSPRRVPDGSAVSSTSGEPVVRSRVLVAADPSQELLGFGVLRVLEQTGNPWEVHGVVVDPDELVRRIVEFRPDVLVATTQVGQAFPPYLVETSGHPSRVILLAEELNGRYEATLLCSGARGVLAFSTPPSGLVRATQEVLDGRTSVSSEAASILLDAPRARPLTEERRAVLRLLARGLSIGDAARELGVSESGVKSHIARIGRATGITGVHALRVNARRLLAEDEVAALGLDPVVYLKSSARSHGMDPEDAPG